MRACRALPLLLGSLIGLLPQARGGELPATAFPGDTWEEAVPESEGVDPTRLAAAVAHLEAHAGGDGVRELVVIRNGRIIWKGSAADRRHGVWSITKVFTSTVLGLLIDDGKCALATRAAEACPVLAGAYPAVTLRDFVTMTSGYRAEGDEPRGGYRHGPSGTPFLPGPPLFAPPGSAYAYWDSAMNQLANILTRIAKEPIEDLFRRRVALPIGMRAWEWGDFGAIEGIAVNGGSGNHGQHVQTSALELARLGHLFLCRGRWGSQRLLGEEWIEAATSVQVPASTRRAHPESEIPGPGVYGFNWWRNGIGPDGRRKWPGAPGGTFAARGYNNNSLFVVPEWGLVVVRLGQDEDDRKISDEVYGAFLEKAGTAITRGRVAWLAGWEAAAARGEIAPRSWKDLDVLFAGEPTLALAGNDSGAANGHWARRVRVEPGRHYLFEARYRAERVDEPTRSVLARLLWRDAGGKLVEQPEYPPTVEESREGGWGAIRRAYAAPPGAVSADLELAYRWDGDGAVWFTAARLEPVPPPPPRKVRLASVHHRPERSSGPAENLESFGRLVTRAAERKADIVCLPEGITVVGTGKTYVEVCEPVPGPSTKFLGKLARDHSLYIVAGLYERDGPAVYNTAVLLGPGGELDGKYRKVCLPREEIDGGITPGDSLPVFETRFGKIGLMVCWDVFFPEPARALGKQGAEVIFLPIWGGNLTLARARAIENQVYLVSSSYDMKTAVFNREGEIIAEGTEAEPVIVTEVDLSERTLWPWLGDFRSRIPREMPAERAVEGR